MNGIIIDYKHGYNLNFLFQFKSSNSIRTLFPLEQVWRRIDFAEFPDDHQLIQEYTY